MVDGSDTRGDLSLPYLLREANTNAPRPPLAILLHGYGSNEKDLFALSEDLPEEFLVLSVRAPFPHPTTGYAWFGLDFSGGVPVRDKAETEKSRSILIEFIRAAVRKFDADPERVFVVGFSQGAMMGLSLLLTTPDLLRGVAALSGRIFESIIPFALTQIELCDRSVFIGHGTEDDLVPVLRAREAKKFLLSRGVHVDYHEYPASHGVHPDEVDDLSRWMKKAANANHA